MTDPSTRRTVRRCTAILSILLATLLILFQYYLGYRGVDVHSREIWDLVQWVSWWTFFGAVAYLIGSVGLSVSGTDSTDPVDTH